MIIINLTYNKKTKNETITIKYLFYISLINKFTIQKEYVLYKNYSNNEQQKLKVNDC